MDARGSPGVFHGTEAEFLADQFRNLKVRGSSRTETPSGASYDNVFENFDRLNMKSSHRVSTENPSSASFDNVCGNFQKLNMKRSSRAPDIDPNMLPVLADMLEKVKLVKPKDMNGNLEKSLEEVASFLRACSIEKETEDGDKKGEEGEEEEEKKEQPKVRNEKDKVVIIDSSEDDEEEITLATPPKKQREDPGSTGEKKTPAEFQFSTPAPPPFSLDGETGNADEEVSLVLAYSGCIVFVGSLVLLGHAGAI